MISVPAPERKGIDTVRENEPGEQTVDTKFVIHRIRGTKNVTISMSEEPARWLRVVAATRKLGVAPLHAKEVLNAAGSAFKTIVVTPEIINRAVDGSILWQVSFRDALILACAEDAACTVVFSEDLNSGQRYGGVRVENPFADTHP
jgi:hypothetical protein